MTWPKFHQYRWKERCHKQDQEERRQHGVVQLVLEHMPPGFLDDPDSLRDNLDTLGSASLRELSPEIRGTLELLALSFQADCGENAFMVRIGEVLPRDSVWQGQRALDSGRLNVGTGCVERVVDSLSGGMLCQHLGRGEGVAGCLISLASIFSIGLLKRKQKILSSIEYFYSLLLFLLGKHKRFS